MPKITVDYDNQTGYPVGIYRFKKDVPKQVSSVSRLVLEFVSEKHIPYIPYVDAYNIEYLFRRNVYAKGN